MIIIIAIESQDISWYLRVVAKAEKKTGLIGVRLEPDLMADVEKEAAEEERPLAMMARILIREAMKARELRRERKKK